MSNVKNLFAFSKIFLSICVLIGFLDNVATVDVVATAPLSTFTRGVSVNKESIPSQIKLISGPWVGGSWSQENEKWLLQFRDKSRADQIPYINLYIVAGMAGAKKGLGDCNLGLNEQKTLCKNGANFVRESKKELTQAYASVARSIRLNYGTYKPIFLHFEPDYYQYQEHSQNGGRMTAKELGDLMNTWTDIYKKVLPNAKLVMDISSWTYDLKYWCSKFRNFDYGGMVGRRFEPFDLKKNANGDPKTYKELIQQSGKKMIVNDSHGVGGKWLPYNTNWENPELVKARTEDGVVAVIQPPIEID
jgi:hypothetical protein